MLATWWHLSLWLHAVAAMAIPPAPHVPTLASPGDLSTLTQVATLQLNAFDPPDEPPSFLATLFGSAGTGSTDRAARAKRLAVELVERLAKGSDILVVKGTGDGDGVDGTGDGEDVLGTADLSEQEMLLPTHSLSEGLYLSSMAVDACARRLGIGRALLEAAETRALSRGAEKLWLHVEGENEAALGLYKAAGYSQQPATAQHASFTNALELRQKSPLLLAKRL